MVSLVATNQDDPALSTLSLPTLTEAQSLDQDIYPLVTWPKSGRDRPTWQEVSPHSETLKAYWAQWDSLEMQQRVLCRQWEAPSGKQMKWQVIIPRTLQREVFRSLHGTPVTVRERVYWLRNHRMSETGVGLAIFAPPGRVSLLGPHEALCNNTLWVLQWCESSLMY